MKRFRVSVEVHPLEQLTDYWLSAEQAPEGPVLVPHARGQQLGWIRQVLPPGKRAFPECRPAAVEDLKLHQQRKLMAAEVKQWAEAETGRLQLPLTIEGASQTHDGERLVLYFSAPDRVDFRALVKALAQQYRKKIELYQLSPRQRTQLDGAAQGRCGLECCCTAWLQEFPSVSVRMADEQGFALQTEAITGVCGRLLCCLRYEYDQLLAGRENPQVGDWVEIPEGKGRVLSVDPHTSTLEIEHDTLGTLTVPLGRAKKTEICQSCQQGTDATAE